MPAMTMASPHDDDMAAARDHESTGESSVIARTAAA
jgi:hypothetical protein